MRNVFWIAAGITWLFLAGIGWAEEDRRTISVTGQGEVAAVPDMAVISLSVVHEDRRADTAMDRVSADVRGMLERLTALGVAERDLQTDQLSLRPVWDQQRYEGAQRPRIVGFVASNGVTARVRDMSALGGILDAVIAEGANQFSGLRFTLQDPKPTEATARAAAVADALARAGQLAAAAGVTLGPVRTISEHGGGGGPVMMEMAAAARGASDVPIAAGELTVQVNVSVEFDLIP